MSSRFILTKGAQSRIDIVKNAFESGIPLLLEGETGTSKTATAKQAAEKIKQRAIIFNFSSQTTVEDLLGRMTKNNMSWSGFSFMKGPYTEAFENGYCLILDEINLAHETVLQCIESSLDSQTLSLDIAGNEDTKTIKMHKNFHLIATQNPLTNRFSQKRNFLSHKFTSRFQIINFDEIKQEELIEIATGLSKNVKNITPNLIKSLVNFHFQWQKNNYSPLKVSKGKSKEKSFSYTFTYTIREICRTIKSIEKGLTPFESIFINYGSRYTNESKEEMKKLLKSVGIAEENKFFDDCSYISKIKSTFLSGNYIKTHKNHQFYMTDIIEKILSISFHVLDNSQSILLVGPDGCGKTSIGRWIGDLYSSHLKEKMGMSKENDYKFFICNPEMTIADIIGRYVPCKKDQTSKNNFINDSPIEWKYGPVIDALKDGNCLILDQIDTAPSTILERLNSLFDGLGEENFKFPIHENLEEPEVKVDPKFRIIAISSLSGLNNLSPAFLNRFTVIYVNEQLDFINDDLQKLIKCLSPYSNNPSAMAGRSPINFLTKEIKERISKKENLTSLDVSRCVKGFFKLKDVFNDTSGKDHATIFNFCSDVFLYHTSKMPTMDERFIQVMLDNLNNDTNNEQQFDSFHFKEAKSTRKVMATLVACSITGLHTILIGRTGIGKTAAAMAFSRMNKFASAKASPRIISFNGETQLDELYGYFTIEKGNFSLHQGELSQAMSDGQVFIADELNLADQQIIQSLNVAIEPSRGENIILPVTGSPLTIKDGFLFIGCQNDLTMNGRRPIPESIKKKILCIDYPEPTRDDLISLCTSIANQFGLKGEIPSFTASLMEEIRKDFTFKPWSLREVRILYKRIAYFQTKAKEFVGFTPMHHFAFMLLSPLKGQNDIVSKIAEIVCSSFNKYEYINSLNKDMSSKIVVQRYLNKNPVNQNYINAMIQRIDNKSDNEYSIKLIKGSLSLMIYNTQLFFIDENIQQLWQTIFEIYITNQSEPLLLIGPSGFKTYLSTLISSLAPIIYLHSDSTVASLIGQITLLDKHQAKISLVDSLYDLTGYDISIKENLDIIKTNLEETDSFDDNLLNECIKSISKNLPKKGSFIPILNNVGKKLINLQKEENENENTQLFSNYISMFKPGLITKSIFSQKSLILKNFAQPSPAVIERFNELLSVTPTLTLFEDTSNTYITPDNNRLSGFSDVFRIIGICKSFEKRNLSDAMLSRLTEIHVSEYSSFEQNVIFNQYIDNRFDKNALISILEQSLKAFDKYKLNISFRQKIKIIQVANKWINKFPEMKIRTIFFISILRCAGGPFPFEIKKCIFESMAIEFDSKEFPTNLSKVFEIDQINETEKTLYQYATEESSLLLNQSFNTIVSNLSGFQSPNSSIGNDLFKQNNIIFTNSINDMIDVIFSFSIINYPIILEGPNGCGKSSSFYYVAKYLGVKVIQISISSSTTVEDLFGRFEPNSESKNIQFVFKPTSFLNAIDDKRNKGEKYWILIEELDLASASVIDSLEPIFNPYADHITLPDGSFVQRGNFFVVGLVSKPLQKQSISNAALYYKVRNYTKNEFSDICRFILLKNGYNQSIQKICPLISHLYEISSSSQIKIPVTARDANKFVKMMKSANTYSNGNNKLSDIEICRILFLGRFFEEDLRESVRLSVNETFKSNIFSSNEEIPEFTSFNNQLISSSKLSIKTLDSSSRHDEFNFLTMSEKMLFQFLILNIEEYTPIIIQGPTASGKTFSIQFFADALGKKLRVVQLNSEINSSYIADSYYPSKELTSKDRIELGKSLELISGISKLPSKFLRAIKEKKIDDWMPSEFFELKKAVESLLASKKLNQSDIEKVNEFITKVNSILLFFNHFEKKDSMIIQAMINGDWLLLDGIESAPSDFLDRLSTLLDDPPILNLYERGNDCVYSTNPKNIDGSKRIHPDFRLLMTYNPVGAYSNSVSPSFLSRCSLFSLDPIDNNLLDSAILIFGIIGKSHISIVNQSELTARIANVHMKIKEKVKNQLTCRTLIHISREITNKSSQINNFVQLHDIIFNHYCNQQNKDISLENIKSFFVEKIDNQLYQKLKDIEKKSLRTRETLIKIIDEFYSQVYDNNKNIEFKLDDFIFKLHQLQFKDNEKVIRVLKKEKDSVKHYFSKFDKRQILLLASFNNLYDIVVEIQSVFKGIKMKDLMYLDSIEVKNSHEFTKVIFKCQLLSYLYCNKLYLNRIPEIFIDTQFANNMLNKKEEKNSIYSIILKSPIFFQIPYKWDKDITPIQQICSCLFKFRECELLFKGLMKDLFNITISIYEMYNFKVFINWIQWLIHFFNCFSDEKVISDFTIEFNVFIEKLHNLKNSNDQEFLMKMMNHFDILKKVPEDLDLNNNNLTKTKVKILFEQLQKINLKDKYMECIENKKTINFFFLIKEKIEKLSSKQIYSKKLNYLNIYMNLISQNLNNNNVQFLIDTYNSIINDSKQEQKNRKNKEILVWPALQYIAKNDDKKSTLLDLLISYSIECERIKKIDLNSPDWSLLCELSHPDELMKELITTRKISKETINKYESFIKAELLFNIFNSNRKESYDYCSKTDLIKFFNLFIDRNKKEIDKEWLIIAQNLSKNYSNDFSILIPSFNPMDILSLLVNPLTKEQGIIFNELKIDKDLINVFSQLFISIQGNQSFDFLYEQITQIFVKYINHKYSFSYSGFDELVDNINDDKKLINEQNICVVVQSVLNLIEKQNNFSDNIDFSDIINIKYDDFDYINKNPSIGFYISQFPEIRENHLKLLLSLINKVKDRNDVFPLALLEFRIFSNINCIQFQLPADFPANYAEEFQDLISNFIVTNIGEITKFSNLIGFLLQKTPTFINNACYSEYIRNIILNLYRIPKENMILSEINSLLKDFLPKILLKLGSPQWNEIINQELKYSNSNDAMIINFMTNPWMFILDPINNKINEEYKNYCQEVITTIKKILNMINDLTSKESIQHLKECVKKDENNLQNKINDNLMSQSNRRINQNQVKVFFGSSLIDVLTSKLEFLYNKYSKYKLKSITKANLEEIENDVVELEQFIKVSFSIENVEKPHFTSEFLSNKLEDLINYVKNKLKVSEYKVFDENYIKRYNLFTGNKNEFQKLYNKSNRFSLQLKNGPTVVQDSEISKIKKTDVLLSPSIFKNGANIMVTIKEINVHVKNLLFGVDLTPLQIKLCNFSDEEIKCEFEQSNKELPIPNYRNEQGFLIIEIPVESLCNNANKYKKADKSENLIDIEHSFNFEGKMKLSYAKNSKSSVEVNYSIKLDYISLQKCMSLIGKKSEFDW